MAPELCLDLSNAMHESVFAGRGPSLPSLSLILLQVFSCCMRISHRSYVLSIGRSTSFSQVRKTKGSEFYSQCWRLVSASGLVGVLDALHCKKKCQKDAFKASPEIGHRIGSVGRIKHDEL